MTTSKKRLEGIYASEEIQELIDKVCAQIPPRATSTPNDVDAPLDRGIEVSDVASAAIQSLSIEDANLIIQDYVAKKIDSKETKRPVVSISMLRAFETILSIGNDATYADQLHSALLSCKGLAFTPSKNIMEGSMDYDSQNLTRDQIKFKQRMERLRLKYEESKYSKLTNNLGMNPELDDVTTKSMTYAASIGLNMIIAPLSFGCFMYFFAGSLLDYFWKREIDDRIGKNTVNTSQPDIRKVIAGVVSGVLMMFIEMILFVIRTHEIDRATRSKSRRRTGVKPFGHYSSNTEKLYRADGAPQVSVRNKFDTC